ncbi:helix-turn-helix domain-containing protein [Pseudomethylobacillus aquaticus]|uniref:helix-turn-helix domain-containing protein n=1 Tax=Pseudomethylobacillus aquaticus TaxID=2676064 RepID=UPI00187B4A4D|nr:helix-turn-helix transcriptional regulator [Pseudomethylobacillus aquaticus]
MDTTQRPTIVRTYSRYAREAVTLLGSLIRINRIERKLTVQALAERVGISRDMMQRIEQGDPRCGIGVVIEAATIVGVALFEADSSNTLTMHIKEQEDKLRLLPKAVHKTRTVVKDDF